MPQKYSDTRTKSMKFAERFANACAGLHGEGHDAAETRAPYLPNDGREGYMRPLKAELKKHGVPCVDISIHIEVDSAGSHHVLRVQFR